MIHAIELENFTGLHLKRQGRRQSSNARRGAAR